MRWVVDNEFLVGRDFPAIFDCGRVGGGCSNGAVHNLTPALDGSKIHTSSALQF